MELKYVFLILASAFMHAFYNLLMLKAKGNRTFLTQMFLVAFSCAALYFIVSDHSSAIKPFDLLIIVGAGFFYVIYQILVAKAYQYGDVSTNYPLTVMSPVFVPFWAALFLYEKPTYITIIGLILTVFGAIVIKSNGFRWHQIKSNFTNKDVRKGAIFAISASLVYSFGSILDKARIASLSLGFYLFILLTVMTLGMVLYTLLFEPNPLFSKFQSHWKLVLIGGASMFASFFFFRDALVVLPVTVAVPFRLTSILFGLLFGRFVLKEQLTLYNWFGAVLIVVGIILVVIS